MSALANQTSLNETKSFFSSGGGGGGGGGGGNNFSTITVANEVQAATAVCALGGTSVASLFTLNQNQGDVWQLVYDPIGTLSSCAISVTGDLGFSGGGIRMGVDVSEGANKEFGFMNGYYDIGVASGQSPLIQDFASYTFKAGGTDYLQIQPGQIQTTQDAIFIANSVYFSSIQDGTGTGPVANVEALFSTLASVYPASFS
jgi:hypothetical protein